MYRVLLDPVILCGACGAPMTWPGGGAKLSCSPGPRLVIAKFWYCIHCLQVSYSVLHCYPRLALDPRLWKWLLSSSPHLWNCLCNCVLLFVQLCLTTCASVSYCLCNYVLLLVQPCLTACATMSYCLCKWLASSSPIYGNGFRSSTSENQRLHKELSNCENRVT